MLIYLFNVGVGAPFISRVAPLKNFNLSIIISSHMINICPYYYKLNPVQGLKLFWSELFFVIISLSVEINCQNKL
jgi:hypothetical protein